jgi:hypothetical protein
LDAIGSAGRRIPSPFDVAEPDSRSTIDPHRPRPRLGLFVGVNPISKPSADEIRRALQRCLQATRAVDEIHDREPPDDAATATHAAFEAEADAAVHQERLAIDELAGLVTGLAGPAPCCLIVEDVVIALADGADGMAIVRENQVVRI